MFSPIFWLDTAIKVYLVPKLFTSLCLTFLVSLVNVALPHFVSFDKAIAKRCFGMLQNDLELYCGYECTSHGEPYTASL